MPDDELRILFATASPDDAPRLVSALVREKLVACGNILPAVRSIYRWEGEVCDDEEAVLLMETTADRLSAAMERLRALHPYDVPEVLALPVSSGLAAYTRWVGTEVESSHG